MNLQDFLKFYFYIILLIKNSKPFLFDSDYLDFEVYDCNRICSYSNSTALSIWQDVKRNHILNDNQTEVSKELCINSPLINAQNLYKIDLNSSHITIVYNKISNCEELKLNAKLKVINHISELNSYDRKKYISYDVDDSLEIQIDSKSNYELLLLVYTKMNKITYTLGTYYLEANYTSEFIDDINDDVDFEIQRVRKGELEFYYPLRDKNRTFYLLTNLGTFCLLIYLSKYIFRFINLYNNGIELMLWQS